MSRTPLFQVLNFRHKLIGESLESTTTLRKTQRKQQHTDAQGTEAESMKTLQTNNNN